MAVLLLSACAADQPGAAAIVGDQRIAVSALQSSAEQVLALQERTGEPTSPAGQVLRTQLTEQVENIIVNEIAADLGITVSDGEVRNLIAETREQVGDQFDIQLARAGISPDDLEDYTRKFLLRDQIARQLAEEGGDVDAAYQQLGVETGNAMGVEIAPRYGSWNAETGLEPIPNDLSTPVSPFTTQPN
jgi:parvulin-like peptidyl-prolyl isomerase